MGEVMHIRILQHNVEDEIRIGIEYRINDLDKAEKDVIALYEKDKACDGGFKSMCERDYKRVAIVDSDTLEILRVIYDREKESQITAKEVFDNNCVLSLHAAEKLTGHKVAVVTPEYKHNTPIVREFVIRGFISEWDHAAEQECEGYKNMQERWSQVMTPERIEKVKQTLLILTDYELSEYWSKVGVRCHRYDCDIFTGSDIDRYAYYIDLGEV